MNCDQILDELKTVAPQFTPLVTLEEDEGMLDYLLSCELYSRGRLVWERKIHLSKMMMEDSRATDMVCNKVVRLLREDSAKAGVYL